MQIPMELNVKVLSVPFHFIKGSVGLCWKLLDVIMEFRILYYFLWGAGYITLYLVYWYICLLFFFFFFLLLHVEDMLILVLIFNTDAVLL